MNIESTAKPPKSIQNPSGEANSKANLESILNAFWRLGGSIPAPFLLGVVAMNS
jgi:hypothetical protein